MPNFFFICTISLQPVLYFHIGKRTEIQNVVSTCRPKLWLEYKTLITQVPAYEILNVTNFATVQIQEISNSIMFLEILKQNICTYNTFCRFCFRPTTKGSKWILFSYEWIILCWSDSIELLFLVDKNRFSHRIILKSYR